MCFKKKQVVESKESKLIDLINKELSNKEQPIAFKFGAKQYDFKFCGFYAGMYNEREQDFEFAKTQMTRAINLLKESLLKIKDAFKSNGLLNKIVINKIKTLLQKEEDFLYKIKEEQVAIQANENKIRMGTLMLFENLSREYMTFVIDIKEQLIDFIKRNFVDYDILNSISRTLKEQPTILPKELRDYKYNINGYSIVYNVENFLRLLIIVVLKGKSTKQILDTELYEYVKEQKKKEDSNKWCDERFGGDLFYLNFNDLVKVIEYNKSEFEKVKIRIDKIKDPIDKFGVIRNKLAHNNLLTEKDLNILKTNSEMIYNYFKDFQEEIKEYKFNLKGKK